MTSEATTGGLPQAIGYQAGTSPQRPDSVRDAAEQFEAKFIQMMLASMRAATPESDSPLSQDAGTYQDLFDRRIAQEVAGQEKLGLAEALVRQLGDGAASGTESDASTPVLSRAPSPPAAPSAAAPSTLSHTPAPGMDLPAAISGSGTANPAMGEDLAASPEAFVAALRPHAEAAGRALGVEPRVLIAQAALETNWGEQVIRHDDGKSTFNVFNVKARDGEPAVERATSEYVGGEREQRVDGFRSYDSLKAAFEDYVALVGTNPRYGQALEASDAGGYLRGLQAGGFATDPAYAEKVGRVLGSERLDAKRVVLQASRSNE